jgi:transglutaminase-like putative cysteine protease
MSATEFLERARHEAMRYGSDPWVFVRELLQNARDAGARTVTLRAEEADGVSRISCMDDGGGMTFEEARRYLFALYASSKENERGAAGRFGVGFWSVLRFEPVRLLVRSWPRRGAAWEVELDGALTAATRRAPPARHGRGTEVVLERASGDGDLARRVLDAARQNGRFLRCRDDPGRALDVRVNGTSIVAPFDLPAPSARFRKGRLRGVVGLGAESRVELFAQGLRVRSASGLEDLLAPDAASAHARVRFDTLSEGVAPQALLDGDDVEPFLARADVRETRALRRLVSLARRELRRLIETQIDAVRPPSAARRLALPALGLFVFGVLLAASWLGRAYLPSRPAPAARGGTPVAVGPLAPGPIAVEPAVANAALANPAIADSAVIDSALGPATGAGGPVAYRDLGGRYTGPRSDVSSSGVTPLALRYTPAAETLLFAALVLERPFEAPPTIDPRRPYEGAACRDGCIEVTLVVDDGPGSVRLPVPSGHLVDPESVRLDGERLSLQASAAGEAIVTLVTPRFGTLRYRTGPAVPAEAFRRPPMAVAGALADAAEHLRGSGATVAAIEAWVRAHMRYSTSADVAERYRQASVSARLRPDTALEIGAGDCDVMNGLFAVLLQATGRQARLAVGYVGAGGIALAPPHAWVEFREGDGAWLVADASRDRSAPVAAAVQRSADATSDGIVPVGGSPLVPPSIPLAARMLDRAWRVAPWLAPALLGVAAALLTGLAVRRTRRVVRLAPQQDLAALVHGALRRPEAFRDVAALYERPLIPLLSGRRLSIRAAWALAAERRLFRGARRSELARRATAGRAAVLDATRPEARAVADTLGATDLDEWDVFLRRCRVTPLLAALDTALRHLGEPWEVRVADGIGSAAVLDLPAATGLARVVVIDADEPWLAAAESCFRARRSEAVFAVAERLAEVLRLSADDRRRVLPPLARAALREAAS